MLKIAFTLLCTILQEKSLSVALCAVVNFILSHPAQYEVYNETKLQHTKITNYKVQLLIITKTAFIRLIN